MLLRTVSEERKERKRTEPRVSTRGETHVLLPTETQVRNFRGLSGGQEWRGAGGGVVLKEADPWTRILLRNRQAP